MSPHSRKRIVVPLLAACALALGAVGTAQAAPARGGADVVINDVQACDGLAQERALTRSNDTPTTIGENAVFVPLPGAVVPFNVPNNQSRQIIVTFSAEAVLGGQTTPLTVPTDSMQLQILLDGALMFPLNDLNFTTDAGHANAIEACKRVGPGNHQVTVQWFLFDQGAASVLTGTLDDWTLHVEINI